MITVALDVSLRSPGVAIRLADRSWALACFAQRKTDLVVAPGWNQLVVWPHIDVTQCDIARYEHIVSHITTFIKTHVSSSDHVQVAFEGYAFGRPSACDYKLKELTGILKYELRQYPQIVLPPTRWKSLLLDNGDATKRDVLQFVQTATGLDIGSRFGYDVQSDKEPPCPAHDLTDAIGIAMALERCPVEQNSLKRKRV